MKTSAIRLIPHAILLTTVAALLSGVPECNAGWSLSSSSGPTYYGSPYNTVDNPTPAYYNRETSWTTGSLYTYSSSMDLELQAMSVETICMMGCVENLGLSNVVTNSWAQVVATATWSYPGGTPDTTTVSNYVSLPGYVHILMQAQPWSGSSAYGFAWLEGGTNGVPPYGWVRGLVNGTNNTPTGIASIFDNRGSWNSGYPSNSGQSNILWTESDCNNLPENCDQLDVGGYFSLQFETTLYTVSAGATSITVNLSADCYTKCSAIGTGGSAYANAEADLQNGGQILAYLLN